MIRDFFLTRNISCFLFRYDQVYLFYYNSYCRLQTKFLKQQNSLKRGFHLRLRRTLCHLLASKQDWDLFFTPIIQVCILLLYC